MLTKPIFTSPNFEIMAIINILTLLSSYDRLVYIFLKIKTKSAFIVTFRNLNECV